VLRLDVSAAHLDGVQLVAADAAIEDLLLSGSGVEGPLAALLDDGHRQGPVVLPHGEDGEIPVLRIECHGLVLAGPGDELLRQVLVLDGILRHDQTATIGTEDALQGGDIERFSRRNQRLSRLLGRIEGLLARRRFLR
jgi:hypothetical protein